MYTLVLIKYWHLFLKKSGEGTYIFLWDIHRIYHYFNLLISQV